MGHAACGMGRGAWGGGRGGAAAPGATTSGFQRPPALLTLRLLVDGVAGPCEEKIATLPSVRVGGFSEAPTVRQFLHVAGAPIEPGPCCPEFPAA